MNGLSDNEIIGTLISISGAKSAGMLMNGIQLWNWNGTTWQGFDALVDDALCFQLMVKYRINFETITTSDGEFVCYDFLWPDGQFYKSLQNDNPNRGICLAIIEAHKEQ